MGGSNILCHMNSTINNKRKATSLAGAMINSIERGSLLCCDKIMRGFEMDSSSCKVFHLVHLVLREIWRLAERGASEIGAKIGVRVVISSEG